MGGAALMLALAHLVMSAQLPVRLRVLVPAVENAISGNAYRPGDVLATRAGITVEVAPLRGGWAWRHCSGSQHALQVVASTGAGVPACQRSLSPGWRGACNAPATAVGTSNSAGRHLAPPPPAPQNGNTDAEGRLILSDALAEAATQQPDLLIDAATLTGGC